MAILKENDILFALKAFHVMTGVSDSARRVAVAIIDHFNKKTGQCDPGAERLATMLGIDRATVLRATEKLHKLDLIKKESHGGKAGRARYLPNWDRFHAIVAEWDLRMKTGGAADITHVTRDKRDKKANENVAPVRPSTSHECDLVRRTGATQTYRSNLSKEPIEEKHAEKPAKEPEAESVKMAQNGLRNGKASIGQRSFMLPFSGGKNVSHMDAARSAAERRWGQAALALGQTAYGEVLEWMDPLRQEAATQAEISRKGGGIAYIVDGMQAHRMHGHG